MKSVLVANHHLSTIGGSENFTFSLIEELVLRGFEVEYFTFKKGIVSDYIENLGVKFCQKDHYDFILASHYTCVDALHKKGIIVQICHGIYPKLEQPSHLADSYVSVSDEISTYLKKSGIKSKVILNGINMSRFNIKKPLSKTLKNVLSLSHSESANMKIKEACEELNLNFFKLNKNENPIWDLENYINDADLVVGIGRSAYDAMACGRPVIIYDERFYSEPLGDGYVTSENIEIFVKNNCSGRYSKKKFTKLELVNEIKKYQDGHGLALRGKALECFDIKNKIDEYLALVNKTSKKKIKISLKYLYVTLRSKRNIKRHKRKFGG